MKKTARICLLIALGIVMSYSMNVQAQQSKENGSIPIYTAQDLNRVRENLSGDYILMNDITFRDVDFNKGGQFYNGGKGWRPIAQGYKVVSIKSQEEFERANKTYGSIYFRNSEAFYYKINSYDAYIKDYYYKEVFTGTFNGNGHEIKNLKINSSDKYVGLFGCSSGKIFSLGLVDMEIQSKESKEQNYIGGVVGYTSGDIYKVYTSGSIKAEPTVQYSYVGGIVGASEDKNVIYECYNTANISCESSRRVYVGGIAGIGTITNAFNNGAMPRYSTGAGIVGYINNRTVDRVYNTGFTRYGVIGSYFSSDSPRKDYCYYLDMASPEEDGFSALKVSSNQLKRKETFAYFNFDTVWQIGKNPNYKYPELQGLKNIISDISEKAIVTFDRTTYPVVENTYIEPNVKVVYNGKVLVKDKDYRVSYVNNVGIGVATAYVDGIGIYTGRVSKTFNIVARNIASMTVDLSDTVFEYTGKSIAPKVSIFDQEAIHTLTSKEYVVKYENNINAGEATAIITGKGSYTGTVRKKFKISPRNISKGTMQIAGQTYTGKSLKPEVVVSYNGQVVAKSNYTIAYKNNINAGYAAAIISGKGNYSGKKEIRFKIAPKSVSSISFQEIKNQVYTGKNIQPAIAGTYNQTILSGKDFSSITYQNNKNIGVAKISFKGKGNFTGSRTLTFRIVPKTVTGIKVAATDTSITLSWKKDSLIQGYEIYRATSKNGTYKKVATLTKNSQIKWSDKKVSSGTAYYYKIRSYKKVSGEYIRSNATSVVTGITKLKTPTLKLTAGKKSVVVTWNATKEVKYQIYRSTKKSSGFNKVATISKSGTNSMKDVKVASKKTYYYKIRAYKVVNGKTIYSSYSSVKSVKSK